MFSLRGDIVAFQNKCYLWKFITNCLQESEHARIRYIMFSLEHTVGKYIFNGY